MIIFTETQTRLGITVGCLFFGFLLAAMGLISGNEPMINPDLREAREIAWKDRITSKQLSEWILSGRRDFYMVGFREGETCLITDHRNRFFECYELKDLKNPFWLRRYFPNMNVPMVVYSGDGSKSLDVSAWLNYYGYKVHMLEGGYQDFVKNYVVPVDVASAVNIEERKELHHKQLLYWYFSGKDPNISSRSYGNTDLMEQGSMLQDDILETPKATRPANVQPQTREVVRPMVHDEAEEGC